MKILCLPVLSACLLVSFNALSLEWKNECVGYYQLALPDNLEVALYQVEDFVNPIKQSEYTGPEIKFEKNPFVRNDNSAQAQYSEFYYGQYKLGISSQSRTPVNWSDYRSKVIADRDAWVKGVWEYQKGNLERFNESATAAESEFKRKYNYIIKDYTDAFALYENRGYSLTVKKDERLYHFWEKKQKDTGDKSQTAEKQQQESEPEVLSLLNRFQSRKLYQVPTAQGFCMPYGFIAGDSGHELRNMGVTYRLKNHPDVTIFFQDFGPTPGPGKRRPDASMNAKDYVTYFWNMRYGHSFRDIKPYGKGFSYPDIDNRKAVAAFAKFTRFSKEVDYGYVAFAKGRAADEPDLFFYVMRDSRQAKDNPPMDKKELEKLAEHIVSSIKRR
ncbi:T6SS immunity protein Tli4 family protein [Cronobacter muytjensii]|uniref:T6SS immunity protein Tli4 family protein n=1 Tax=Cronobacter muytjensii TaxID=413501 RepID=UPI0034D6CB9E